MNETTRKYTGAGKPLCESNLSLKDGKALTT